MKYKIITSFFCLSFIFPGFALAGQDLRESSFPCPANIQKIRVLVVKPRNEIKISCVAPYEIHDSRGARVSAGEKLPVVSVRGQDPNILFGDRPVPGDLITVQSAGAGVRVGDSRVYGDTIAIKRVAGNRVEVINYLPVDDYLKGVVPVEANPLWGLEALKAQAVASRTFAVYKMTEQAKEPYDVTSGVYSQVYAGKKIENPRTNQAVEDTAGEVLTFKKRIFPGYFHSTCGGRTTDASQVWRIKPLEPLRGVECKFCAKSPHYRWESVFTPEEIKTKMAEKGGIPVQEVKGIRCGKIDLSGRAHEIIIRSTWMEKTVDADAFRVWMGPDKFKSNLITKISTTPEGKFKIRGRGWGHGAGMCQYGMKYLGELGYGYREILSYYYPGAEIVRLPDSGRGSVSEE